MPLSAAREWHFDIDTYLNPYIPRNRLDRLPKPLTHFLGYRDKPREPIGNVLQAGWALIGAFVGILVIEAVLMIPTFKKHNIPLIIASYVREGLSLLTTYTNHAKGAAAVLEFNTIESPLAQPRNAILGHTISVLSGVSITKLFALSSNFEDIRYLAGPLACGLASGAMSLTKTVYPPAGATALLAATDPQVEAQGWFLVPLILLSSALTLVTSLIINNIQRQYPTYWWTPVDLGKSKKADDIETLKSSSTTLSEPKHLEGNGENSIMITPQRIIVPNGFYLAAEEKGILEILRDRLGERLPKQAIHAVQPPSLSSFQKAQEHKG